eukprot:CAMPEP_0180799264 /NCGR_PEP_ID=MMETSP1038_2-20121128/58441_1 /TAXON_ID=632150 /ORGANISM="Azadinium spinosum, Strain 3D9" /LENGTH=94 /DNA_ID=CAMNT_0022838841 /DNA_START=1 /DNA_END=286 /DNA_ORIENTATION=+
MGGRTSDVALASWALPCRPSRATAIGMALALSCPGAQGIATELLQDLVRSPLALPSVLTPIPEGEVHASVRGLVVLQRADGTEGAVVSDTREVI